MKQKCVKNHKEYKISENPPAPFPAPDGRDIQKAESLSNFFSLNPWGYPFLFSIDFQLSEKHTRLM